MKGPGMKAEKYGEWGVGSGRARRSFWVAVLAGCWAGAFAATGQDDLGGPRRGLLRLPAGADVEAGLMVRVEQRSLEVAGGRDVEADVLQFMSRAAYAPVHFFQVYAEGGWARADLDVEDDGDGDAAWGAGFQAAVYDLVIEESPVVGQERVLSLRVEGAFRQVSSGFRRGDLDYDEFVIMPMVRYAENKAGRMDFRPYHAAGVTASIGVAYSTIDGELGDREVEESQSAGLALGAAWRSWGSWLLSLDGVVYDEGDFSLTGGLRYLF